MANPKHVRLLMIGHSHIDPVWFWRKEEGMQEVKATFLSALARMEEFEDFVFTASSAAFYEYMEQNCPEAFEQIRRRVAEGRWEITGGWYVEADACLPCGESLVRQALYGQRYFASRFGRLCSDGFAPDTFGHPETLPMLLNGAGMTGYPRQRPNRKSLSPAMYEDRPDYVDQPILTRWEYKDGSAAVDFHLPSEYTIWFEEKLLAALNHCIAATPDGGELPCFFGVGNHGGGPTIANIRAVEKHARYTSPEGDRAELAFSRLDEFFARLDMAALPASRGERRTQNSGCHSMDTQLKKVMHDAEHALLRAEKLCTMAQLLGAPVRAQGGLAAAFEALWKPVLFNQFHDTLCGTASKTARDAAVRELGGAAAAAAEWEARAVQAMVNQVDTRSEDGNFPLFIFNPHMRPYEGPVELELPWFCKAHLALLDEAGNEIPYQRVKTECTMIHYNLGGLRRVVAQVKLPSFGYTVLRAVQREPGEATDTGPAWLAGGLPENAAPHTAGGPVGPMGENGIGFTLENEHVAVELSPATGLPAKLVEKATGWQPLAGPGRLEILADEGDSWGWAPGQLAEEGEVMRATELRLLEDGPLRKVAKATCEVQNARVELLYTLYAGEQSLRCSVRVFYDKPRTTLALRFGLAAGAANALAQVPYGATLREDVPGVNFMHSFLDVAAPNGCLTLVNDGVYSYTLEGSLLSVALARSGIYSHGNAKNWYSEHSDYDYADRGRLEHEFLLTPHRAPRPQGELWAEADRLNQPPVYLLDTFHAGRLPMAGQSALAGNAPGLVLASAKPGEEDDAPVLRFLNTENAPAACTVTAPGGSFAVKAAPGGLATVALTPAGPTACDLLERPL